jgi:endoglucanase
MGRWGNGLGRRSALGVLALAGVASAQSAPPVQAELIIDGDFGPAQTAWGDAPIVDGRLCVDVPGGTINPWDVGISQAGVPIVAGETYELSFDASSSPRPVTVRALVQVPSPPYATALDRNPTLGVEVQHHSFTFTAGEDLTAAVSVQVGGASEPWTFCLDNLSLKSGATLVPYAPDTGPRVRVNQLGYLPAGPKGATLVTSAEAAVAWGGCHVGPERARDPVRPRAGLRSRLPARG